MLRYKHLPYYVDPPTGPPHLAVHFVLFHPLLFLSSRRSSWTSATATPRPWTRCCAGWTTVSAGAQAEALPLCSPSASLPLLQDSSFDNRASAGCFPSSIRLRLNPSLLLCRSLCACAEGGVEGVTVCDAGCGTGSLSIPLALRVGIRRPV